MRACPNTARAVSDVLQYKTELTVEVHGRATLIPMYGLRAQQRAAHSLRRLHHGPQGPRATVCVSYRIVLCVVAAPALVKRQIRAIHPAPLDVDRVVRPRAHDTSRECVRREDIPVRVRHVLLAEGANGRGGGGAEEEGTAAGGGALEVEEGVGEVGPGVFEEAEGVLSC